MIKIIKKKLMTSQFTLVFIFLVLSLHVCLCVSIKEIKG